MIADNLHAVAQRIAQACQQCDRPVDAVRLLAVSKTFGPDAVQAAFDAGQRAFGENYLQEALDKMAALQPELARALPGQTLEWHFIGPIQSNKTRQIAEHFAPPAMHKGHIRIIAFRKTSSRA